MPEETKVEAEASDLSQTDKGLAAAVDRETNGKGTESPEFVIELEGEHEAVKTEEPPKEEPKPEPKAEDVSIESVKTDGDDADHAEKTRLGRKVAKLEATLESTLGEMRTLLNAIATKGNTAQPVELEPSGFDGLADDDYLSVAKAKQMIREIARSEAKGTIDGLTKKEAETREAYKNSLADESKGDTEELADSVFQRIISGEVDSGVKDPSLKARLDYATAKAKELEFRLSKGKKSEPVKPDNPPTVITGGAPPKPPVRKIVLSGVDAEWARHLKEKGRTDAEIAKMYGQG